jgi:hypothetical protein
MQLNDQLKDIQRLIIQSDRSKEYYKKQFEASIKDNEELRKHFNKLNKCYLTAMCWAFAATCAFIYTLLVIK